MTDTCGYTVTDGDGIEEPCGRPVTGWRWYQDVEHEDLLDTACDWHSNEGGRRIHLALALADEWESRATDLASEKAFIAAENVCLCSIELRAAIKGEA